MTQLWPLPYTVWDAETAFSREGVYPVLTTPPGTLSSFGLMRGGGGEDQPRILVRSFDPAMDFDLPSLVNPVLTEVALHLAEHLGVPPAEAHEELFELGTYGGSPSTLRLAGRAVPALRYAVRDLATAITPVASAGVPVSVLAVGCAVPELVHADLNAWGAMIRDAMEAAEQIDTEQER